MKRIAFTSLGLLIMYLLPMICFSQITTPAAYSGSINVSYIRTWDAVKPDSNSNNFVTTSALQHSRMATQYIDGMGRPIQTVVKQGSLVTGSSAIDLVSPVVYDEFGRETYKYLPFAANNTGSNTHISDGLFKLNPFQQDSAFNKSRFNDENWYYGQINFEASPLNRVMETFAPGNNWVGTSGQSSESNRHSVKMKYWINTATDSLRIWNVTDVSGAFGTYTASGMYPAGTLFKNVTADENNKQVIEFKDKEGKIILKKVQLTAAADTGTGKGHYGWLNTYYIYDDLNNLRCVIQPRGVELLMANSWSFNSAILTEQCFRYEYGARGRMIMKKVPGAGIVYLIYDARDRLVMTQDSLMRASHKWLYTLYDVLNRPTTTGLITDNTNYNDPSYHWNHADTSTAYPNTAGYTNEPLTKTFYDDYTWRSSEGNPLSATRSTSYDSYLQTASNTTWPYPQSATVQSSATRGMVTGTKTAILSPNGGAGGGYLYTVSFYDDKARVIQTQSQNISGGTDIALTQYSWAGQVLLSIVKNEKAVINSQTSLVLTQMTYDSLMRVVKIEKKASNTKVNNGNMPGSWTTEVQNEYDALGQLKKKKLGAAPLDSLTYEYNIRGWMLGMNRSYVKDTTSTANWFGFDLGYDKTSFTVNGGIKSYTAAQYNGNITGMLWRSTGDDMLRKYDFTYDAVNRLTGADFNQLNSNSFSKAAKIDFSVNGLTYDANGNILKMNQKGWKLGGSVTIDSLLYGYNSNSNKLNHVTDKTNDVNTKLGDFKETTNNTSQDYSYDGNGNMYIDNNKAISLIHYNILNLPDSIVVSPPSGGAGGGGNIKYTYDAVGNKLKKVTTEGAKVTTTLYLFGNFVNDTLQYLPTEEGRVRFNVANSSLQYDYFIKDHLGNIRMVLTDQKDSAFYPAVTFEDANTTNEQIYYENAGDQRTTRPGSFYTSGTNGSKVQLLRKNIQSVGAGKLLKVMAGDRLHIKVDYYVENTTTDNNNANGQSAILTVLSSLINSSSVTTGFHGGGSTVTTNLNNSVPFTSFISPENGGGGTMPKAYLNILFFDEQFNFVSANSEIVQVTTKGSGQTITRISSSAKQAAKSGYAYVFVSNESNNLVYFDNLQITHERGPLIQDQAYSPWGLQLQGISSNSLNFGNPASKYKYNGKEEQRQEFSDGSGLEWLDYGARMYDNQIGRWHTVDNKAELYFATSLYVYALNQPTNAIDPNGNLVIFINGMHTGDGGKADYWRMYKTNSVQIGQRPVYDEFGVRLYSEPIFRTYKTEIYAFDKAVMNQLGDNNVKYKDGALGGIWGIGKGNLNPRWRALEGRVAGKNDAKDIIENLSRDKNGNITESIKIISHSMGGAYAKAYVQAILEYAKKHNIQGVRIAFEADFAPFQPWDQKAVGGSNMGTTFQFSHSNDRVAGNEDMPGATMIDTSEDKNQTHSIFSFINQISKLPTGKYKVVNGQIIPDN